MRIYNSATHKKEEFQPIESGKVRMYVCGPTVYDNIHIGNARTFISFDVIRRWLIASGYEVTFAQNLTDVDDKIIKRANEQGRTAAEVATEFSDKFIGVMRAANVLDPDVRPRATKEIGPMIAMIKTLIEQGHAYAADNGDVYFAVRSDPSYGQVSGRNIDDLMVGARIEENEDKNDPLDFALWKAAKPGEPSWPSPWGEGRPGWHTECAAMVHRYLGTPIDIHGGGSDLAFPHHENECAQATCAWHQGFSNTWMHTGMLLVDGEKMSKSLGNFFTLAEVLELFFLMIRQPPRATLFPCTTERTGLQRIVVHVTHCIFIQCFCMRCIGRRDPLCPAEMLRGVFPVVKRRVLGKNFPAIRDRMARRHDLDLVCAFTRLRGAMDHPIRAVPRHILRNLRVAALDQCGTERGHRHLHRLAIWKIAQKFRVRMVQNDGNSTGRRLPQTNFLVQLYAHKPLIPCVVPGADKLPAPVSARDGVFPV